MNVAKGTEISAQISTRLVGMSNNLKRKSSLDDCLVPEKRVKFDCGDPICLMRVIVTPTELYDDISLLDFNADDVFQDIGMFEGLIDIDDLLPLMFGPNPMQYT